MTKPWTPDMLAERWGCSGETVRAMIRDGRLPAFRVGRMLRVTQQALEEYECGSIESGASMGASSSHGPKQASADAIVLLHSRSRTQSAKPAT